jgi:hypothetical protein
MIITETRPSNAYSLFSLNEIKQNAKLEQSDTTDDSLLNRLLKVSITEIEKRIGEYVAITNCVLEEDSYLVPFFLTEYTIPHSRITITGITVTNSAGVTSSVTSYFVEKKANTTIIRFNPSISGCVLKIYFTAGYTSIACLPADLVHAAIMRTCYYYDVNRNGTASNQLIDQKTFEKLLAAHTNLIY